MILVDTSVWVDYLREGDERLASLLIQGQVCIHSMIIGELACGLLRNRVDLLSYWQNLPSVIESSHSEALFLLESHKLMGKGIGYVDLHLLTGSLLTGNAQLWTRDKRLKVVAQSLLVAYPFT